MWKKKYVVLEDDHLVEYAVEELDDLSLAFSITIHKSQGSEYPVVVLPILTSHFVMLQRNLLYTALTRGKKYVFVLGQKKQLRWQFTMKELQKEIQIYVSASVLCLMPHENEF